MTAVSSLEFSVLRGTEVRLLRVQNEKLLSKLREIANECGSCGGTGCVSVLQASLFDGRMKPVTEDCGDCLDIRELLQ
jgi:bacterioferritin-associated ferredoxin